MPAAGEVYWALVPYTPAAPFRIYNTGRDPIEIPDVAQIVDGLRRGGDAEFTFLVGAKARPVILLSGRSDPRTGDLFALRLARLGELEESERRAIRDQREPQLFHLRTERFPHLAEESAAMVTAPVRVNESAIDGRQVLGRLDPNEMRVLVERFVTYWGFDLDALLRTRLAELKRRKRRGSAD
jgi:hypothetical protein